MPKARTKNNPPPDGWELIESTLNDFDHRMRDAEMESDLGKRKVETVWPIFRIHHQRSRYIYEMYSQRKEISRELYDYCLREGYADGNLIAKWKKGGYERLCCLRCIQSKDTNYGTTCICRVPKENLEEGKIVQCLNCGCRGCSSGDTHATITERTHTHTELPIASAHHTRTLHNQTNNSSTSSSSSSSSSLTHPSIPTVIPPVPNMMMMGIPPGSSNIPYPMPYPYTLPPGYLPPGYPFPGGYYPPLSVPPSTSTQSSTSSASSSSSSASSSHIPSYPGYPPYGYPPYGYPLPPGYPLSPGYPYPPPPFPLPHSSSSLSTTSPTSPTSPTTASIAAVSTTSTINLSSTNNDQSSLITTATELTDNNIPPVSGGTNGSNNGGPTEEEE